MQAFRFRLDKVLDWYTRQYQLEEARFAVCLAALVEARKAIAALHAERLAVEQDMLSRHQFPAREFAALGLYRLRAGVREVALEEDRGRAEAQVAEQRLKVQAAQRRVRLLEKLKARKLADHTYEETRELELLAADSFFAKYAANVGR